MEVRRSACAGSYRHLAEVYCNSSIKIAERYIFPGTKSEDVEEWARTMFNNHVHGHRDQLGRLDTVACPHCGEDVIVR